MRRKLFLVFTVLGLVLINVYTSTAQGSPGTTIRHAAVEEGLTEEDIYTFLEEETHVTTAARKQQPILEAPSAITVITEEQIRQSGATNIADILRSVSGLDVLEESSYNTSVGARGLTGLVTNNILVMQDGRELHGGLSVGINWKETPLFIENIKRIEILKGPGSTLYGTNAFSGVINIITKSPEEGKGHVATLGYGERNTQQYHLGYGNKANKLSYSVMAGKNKTNGYGKTATVKFTDRYDANLLTGRFWYSLPKNASLKFDGGHLHLVEGFPGVFGPAVWPTDNVLEKNYLDLSYNTYPTESSALTIRGYNQTTRTSWDGDPSGLKSPILEKSSTADIQSSMRLSRKNFLVTGLLVRTASYRSPVTNPDITHHLTFFGSYIQDEFKASDKLIFTPGVRYDHHSKYGSQVSPRITAVYLLTKGTSMRWTYSEAFRSPTPNELFFDFNFFGFQFIPNIDLKPEVIKSYEIGIQHRLNDKVRISADIFSNVITDRIEMVNAKFLFGFPVEAQSQNVSEDAEALGGEIGLEVNPVSWITCFANHSYQDVKLKENKTRVNNMPFNKANFGVTFKPIKTLSNTWLVHYTGKRSITSSASPVERFAGYTITDVNILVTFMNNMLEFSIGAKNVFNKKHYENPTWTKLGRTVTSRLSYKF